MEGIGECVKIGNRDIGRVNNSFLFLDRLHMSSAKTPRQRSHFLFPRDFVVVSFFAGF